MERGDMFLYSISIFFTPLIIMMVWLVINTSGHATIFSYDELAFYFLASTLIKATTLSWVGRFIPSRIKRGAISPYLLRPAPYILDSIANNIAEKLLRYVFLVPIVLAVSFVLHMHWPAINFVNFALFSLSLAMAAVIFFVMDVTVGILAFWLEETRALQEIVTVADSFFSGRVIPFLMLPVYLQSISKFLPFRYTLSFPLEIILNKLPPGEMIQGFTIQIIYLISLILIYKFLWKKGLKLYSASGA